VQADRRLIEGSSLPQPRKRRRLTVALQEVDNSNKRLHIRKECQDIRGKMSPRLLFGCVFDVLSELTMSPLVGILVSFTKQLSCPQRYLIFCATAPLQSRYIGHKLQLTKAELQEIVDLYQDYTCLVISASDADTELANILVSTPSWYQSLFLTGESELFVKQHARIMAAEEKCKVPEMLLLVLLTNIG
jgi:hypothetical protein